MTMEKLKQIGNCSLINSNGISYKFVLGTSKQTNYTFKNIYIMQTGHIWEVVR